MSKKAIVEYVARDTHIKRKIVKQVIDSFTKMVAYFIVYAEDGDTLYLGREVGKLVVKKQKARKMKNPKTGEIIEVPERKAVRFKMSKHLKEALKALNK